MRILLALALSLLSLNARGEDYPAKPVRLIVPYATGGNADLWARILAQKLSENVGSAFVVENKPGANGSIGTDYVAKSAPDGYTVLAVATGPMSVNPVLYPRVAYDPLKDFAPVAQCTVYQYVLVVLATSPYRTLDELIAAARARPGELAYGSTGVGGGNHLATELLGLATGTRFTHVPYKGSGPALADVFGGQLAFMFDTVFTSVPHLRSGKLRAFAVSSAKRASSLPEVPTMQELGLRDFDISQWQGIFVPAGTPRPIVERLNAEVVKPMHAPDVVQRIAVQGGNDIVTGAPEALGALVRRELESYGRLIREARITP
ncbi:MAG: tripartite tricarboxylate transporter substrate binding protein [Betaproteobacteria bacterium]|nr:tripartite tricarboxylate transporter substrate binding protein [Betaproteobacteria bacterium]